MDTLDHLFANSKNSFDLTAAQDQESLLRLVEALEPFSPAEVERRALEKDAPLEFKLAFKVLDSRQFVKANTQPMKVGFVFAMWGEQNRLLPKSADNPNGEDLLNVKLAQLDWLFRGSPVDWQLYAVDDGCPYGSGRIASEIVKGSPLENRVSVLFLEEALPADSGPLKNLASANDSRKGGAIILGCRRALEDGAEAVIYTDADNSVHLGQAGLLLRKHLEEGFKVVLGNRKHKHSVLVKQESRWGIGIKALRHMQRMVGHSIFSRGILDSQAAFKLYHRDVLERILEKPSVYDFSFDSDWIACALAMEEPFAKVPFAFIDSFAESASIVQGPMTTWETLLKGLVTAVRERGVPYNEEMARVLDEHIASSKDLDALINHLPEELEAAEDKDLGDPAVMSPAAMAAWIVERKREAVVA
ncbi:MAG: glycosyltransferase [Phaeodactylibacter sp.]|nr:glycosyltransferase [Phaeodactylibacter sp.]